MNISWSVMWFQCGGQSVHCTSKRQGRLHFCRTLASGRTRTAKLRWLLCRLLRVMSSVCMALNWCQISGLSFPCCRHDCLCMRWTLHMYHMPRPCLTLPYLRCQQIAILLHYHGTAWMVGSKLSSFFRLEASFGAGLSMEHDKLLQWASQVPRLHVI